MSPTYLPRRCDAILILSTSAFSRPDNSRHHGHHNAEIEAHDETRHLNRSEKIEKALGDDFSETILGEKEVTSQSMRQQVNDLATAERLQAQTRSLRGHAAGVGANPDNVAGDGPIGGTQNGGSNMGPTAAYAAFD